MSTTPNMNIILPTPTVTNGPDWAEAVNDAIETIDDHDHSSGKGKKVTSAGIDINLDLEMNSNRLIETESVKFEDHISPLIGATHAGSVYESDGDLYYTNAGGVAVQITDGNDIVSNVVVPPSPLMPSGTILDYAGITIPVGFLNCDGAAVSRVTYSDLFSALGTSWGVGNGSTTFNVPDLRGYTTIGAGQHAGLSSRTLGQKTGTETHQLVIAELASHTHVQDAHAHVQQYATSGSGTNYNTTGAGFTAAGTPSGINTNLTVATNQSTGSGTGHNNMQPSGVVWKMIKT